MLDEIKETDPQPWYGRGHIALPKDSLVDQSAACMSRLSAEEASQPFTHTR